MPQYLAYAIIATVFAGVTSVIARQGMGTLSGDEALLIRSMVVFVLMGLFAVWNGTWGVLPRAKGADVLWLAVSGVTTFGSWLYYYRAIKDGPVSEVALIDKGSIVITILLAAVVLGEPITLRKGGALVLILSGVLLLLKR